MKGTIYPNTRTEDYSIGYDQGFNEGKLKGYNHGFEVCGKQYKEKLAKLSATLYGLSNDLQKFLDSQE